MCLSSHLFARNTSRNVECSLIKLDIRDVIKMSKYFSFGSHQTVGTLFQSLHAFLIHLVGSSLNISARNFQIWDSTKNETNVTSNALEVLQIGVIKQRGFSRCVLL
jgi:hypothetical protein